MPTRASTRARAPVSPRPDPGDDLYRALVENSNDILYATDAGGSLVYLGLQFERYGYPGAEVVRRGVMEFIHPDDRERVAADVARSIATGEEFPTEFRVVTADGEERWLEDRGRIQRDEAGQVTGMLGVLRDVTERRRAEEALRASEERFRVLAEQSFDTIFAVDRAGRLSYVSPAAERVCALPASELVGARFASFMRSAEPGAADAVLRRLLAGERVEGQQLELARSDGARLWVELNAGPVVQEGEVVGAQGIVRDVSARRAMEQQILQMQKMEAIGTLAGGVAHDFNNLLTGILGYANYIKLVSVEGDTVHKAADVVERAAGRAAELTSQLLGFARKGRLRNRPVDLHETIHEVVELLGRTIDKRIATTCRLEARDSVVRGDPSQLQQVLLNLAVNAQQAMPDGGELTLGTLNRELDPARAAPPELAPGRYLVLRVRDTGVGMPRQVRERIFEPFFTTKEPGSSSGMGLATAYGIVRNHGGWISVGSDPGQGSEFELLFPVAARASAPAEASDAEQPERAFAAHVLVVDDEPLVHEVTDRLLSSLGCTVSHAMHGREALERYGEIGADVDVVLLDLAMPVMGGRECFEALRARDPDVRVVLTTGHAVDGAVQALLDSGVVGFIQKPYVRRELAREIRRAARVDEPPPGPSA